MMRLGFIEKAKLPDLWSKIRRPLHEDCIHIRRISPAIVRGTVSEFLMKMENWCDTLHADSANLLENIDYLDEDSLTDPGTILKAVAEHHPEHYDAMFRYVTHATILNGLEDVFEPITRTTKPTEDHLKDFVSLFNRNSYGVEHDSILLTPKRILYYGERQGCVTFVPDDKFDLSHADSRDNALDLLLTFCRQFATTTCNDMMQMNRSEHEFDLLKQAAWDFNEQVLDVVEAMYDCTKPASSRVAALAASTAQPVPPGGAVILAFKRPGT